MALRSRLASPLRRLALVGVVDRDSDQVRAQKATLTLSTACVTGLAVVWVGTYWILGLTQAAAIPFVYQIASVASIAIFARTKNYGFFR